MSGRWTRGTARPAAALLAALVATAAIPAAIRAARADDVTDQIGEALKAYEKQDLSTAAAALDAAQNLIRQQRADRWKGLLPPAPPGWTAEDAEAVTVGAVFLGGGTSVSRKYHRGDASVEVSLIADSPVMQGLGALITSGLMSTGDSKLMIIDGRKATYSRDDNAYQLIVAGKVLIKIAGGHGVDDATLRLFLSALRYADIEKAAQ